MSNSVISHNLQAMNTFRQMGSTQLNQAKSMEKLSSGYRINRAGDDAAGLAISEKMRGQIKGLHQASRNAQDGISLIQTAEGALTETQNILQRMRELAVQSSNDTNVDADRTAIQNEIDQLTQEIDRISETSEFNTQKLLDGTFKGKKFQIGANETQSINIDIEQMNTVGLGLTGGLELSADAQTTNVSALLSDGTYTVDGTSLKDADGNQVGTVNNDTITLADGTTTVQFSDNLASGDKITVSDGGTKEVVTKAVAASQTNTLSAGTYTISGTNLLKDGELIGAYDSSAGAGTVTFADGSGTLDIGATFGITAPADGHSFTIKGVDLSNRQDAEGSITAIDKANNMVSAQRAKLGAIQNRLEHTIANDDTSAENLQAAESRIRDVDMAKEMMEFTKNNILSQAAQSMLAQANQAPQSVLQLLR